MIPDNQVKVVIDSANDTPNWELLRYISCHPFDFVMSM